jgi:hypothetical protein
MRQAEPEPELKVYTVTEDRKEFSCCKPALLVKVKLSLCLTKHHAMKEYWEWRYSSTHSLTSALDGGEWSVSRPCCFTPRERAPGTHWIGGWVSTRAVLDAVSKRKIPNSCRNSNPDHPARSQSLYRLSYGAIFIWNFSFI